MNTPADSDPVNADTLGRLFPNEEVDDMTALSSKLLSGGVKNIGRLRQVAVNADLLNDAGLGLTIGERAVIRSLAAPASGMNTFVQAQLADELKNKTLQQLLNLRGVEPDDNQRIMKLALRLNNEKDAPDLVLIRSCYCELLPLIEEALRKNDVLLAGSRGTGKSVFGEFVAIRAAAMGRPVVYRRGTLNALLLGNNLEDKYRKALQPMFAKHGFQMPSEAGAWEFDPNHLALLMSVAFTPETLVVHDIGDEGVNQVLEGGAARRLFISSPNSDRLKFTKQHARLRRFFMPLWSEPELLAARRAAYADKVSEDDVRSRFRDMGGFAYYVLDFRPGEAEALQRQQIETAEIDMLSAIFLSRSFENIPRSVTYGPGGTNLLFKVEPLPNDYTKSTCTIVSKGVAQELAQRFASAEEDKVLRFANSVRDNPSFGAFRGLLFEQRAHHTLCRGGPFTLRELLGGITPPKESLVKFEALLAPIVFRSLEEITAIKRHDYLRPKGKNFKSVDSFALLPKSYFDGKAKPDVLILAGFQMTVSAKHSVNGTGLKKVLAHVRTVTKLSKLQLVLLFISDYRVISQPQAILQDNGQAFKSPEDFVWKQFGISLGSGFESFVQVLREVELGGDE